MTEQPNEKYFTVTGLCVPEMHYMVDTSAKIELIAKKYVSRGEYFTINRARQFGKTTTLSLLAEEISNECIVISLSFEGRDGYFDSMGKFADSIRADFAKTLITQNKPLARLWKKEIDLFDKRLRTYSRSNPELFFREKIEATCAAADKPVVLMIDEIDRATDFDVFIIFLGILRDMYLERNKTGTPTFQSVILAGVHDVKNLKKKIRPDSEHAYNSPWNIAADFDIDLSFSAAEIATMLEEYEADRHSGMDIEAVSEQVYYYSNGYPFLVSKLCKTIDESSHEWTVQGVDDAAQAVLSQTNTLFDDLKKNVLNNEEFKSLLESILLRGSSVGFEPDNPVIDLGVVYGILKNESGKTRISNIIFETRITNLLISISDTRELTERYVQDNRFVKEGRLDMDAVASRFAAFMQSEYRDEDGDFVENHARLLFLSFLKPIINGTGNYVVEPRTRNNRRMDVVVFYGGDKFVIELKIWRGEKYEAEGFDQLSDYLDAQEQTKGWLISFADTKKAPRESSIFNHSGFTINETVIAYRAKD